MRQIKLVLTLWTFYVFLLLYSLLRMSTWY